MRLTERFKILALVDLRRVFAASLVSNLGDGIVRVALAFAVLDLTHSVSDLGIVLASSTIAQVGVLLVGGVVADRVNRRVVMIGADLTRFCGQAVVGVLLLTHSANVWELALSQALLGAASGFFGPASIGLLPAVAGEYLQEANALNSLANSASSLVGPAIGGVLVVAVGPSWALIADSLSYGLSALCLTGINAGAVLRTGEHAVGSFLTEFVGGFREVVSRSWLWTLIIGFAVANALAVTVDVLGPAMCKQHYGGAPAFALLNVMWAVGSLLGGVLMLRVKPRRPLLFGLCMCMAFPIPELLLGLQAPLALIAMLQLLAGTGPVVFNTLWFTAVQQNVPKEAISRVISFDMAGSFALQPIALVLAGPLSKSIGLGGAMLALSGAALGLSMIMFLVPGVWNLRSPPPVPDIVSP